MAYQIIPLTTDPNQTFTCTLTIDGRNRRLSFFLSYNELAGYWTMDITDKEAGKTLLASVPLVPGEYPSANILQQHSYLGIGSAYVLSSGVAATEYPSNLNLGSEWVLVWSDTA